MRAVHAVQVPGDRELDTRNREEGHVVVDLLIV
jgi:hypothetical protein